MPPLTPFLYVLAICMAASGYLIVGLGLAAAALALHALATDSV